MTQTKQAKHTALPWKYLGSFNGRNLEIISQKYDSTLAMNRGAGHVAIVPTKEYGIEIKGTEAEANAALIIKSVNSHEELLGALQRIVACIQSGEPGLDGLIQVVNYCDAVAREAIAHATGE